MRKSFPSGPYPADVPAGRRPAARHRQGRAAVGAALFCPDVVSRGGNGFSNDKTAPAFLKPEPFAVLSAGYSFRINARSSAALGRIPSSRSSGMSGYA